MDKMNKQEFRFAYSADEQEEIKAIRKKYLPQEEDKLQKLRSLDAYTKKKANTAAIILGVVGSLILGGGMSMITVLHGNFFIPGIFVGLVGMAVLGAAYPIYQKIVTKERKKVASAVLKLTEDLMNGER